MCLFCILQQVFFDVGVEGRLLCPAVGEEGLENGGFDVGGDGAFGAVVFVVALAGKEADEAVLDGTLQMAGHVIVHLAEAEGHTDGFGRTILGTVGTLHPGVPEIDRRDKRIILWNIVLQDATQAVRPHWADLALADSSFCHYFSVFLFFCFDWCRILLNHIHLLCFYRFRQQRYHSFFG